jgi:5-methyltetrahydrofolate--homocysteine methyltransferase
VEDLRTYLEDGHLLIADGATGTMLQSMGLPPGVPLESWNVDNPTAVRALYRAYLDSGSQVILANTFGGNRIKLDRAGGLGSRVRELNRAAVELAWQEAAGRAYVGADIGPTGELMTPLGSLEHEQAVDVYAEQVQIVADAGADLIWIETMSDLGEAAAAIRGAKQAATLPVFCSLSFGRAGRTMMGVSPRQAVQALWPLGTTAIGGNCGEGVEVMTLVLSEMRTALAELGGSRMPVLIAKPNAGLPHLVDGKAVFDLGPEDLAARVPGFVELGAQVLGACCGSSPAHIAAIVRVCRERLLL